MNNKVAPDGVVLDHLGEFVYGKRKDIDDLFPLDEGGYRDAVFKFVQGLVCSNTLLGSNRKPLIDETAELKEQLLSLECLEASDFFATQSQPLMRSEALRWLEENWQKIVEELGRPGSTAASAISGHIKREFYYAWVRKHPGWNPERYFAGESTMTLPPPILHRLVQDAQRVAESLRVPIPESLGTWVDQNISAHYRIFREYSANLHEDYLPAWTRTSLLLSLQTPDPVEEVVLPFVALKAIEKVSERRDLVKRVVDWKNGEGKKIVEGIGDWQQDFHSTTTRDAREKKLAEIKRLLGSSFVEMMLAFLNAKARGRGTSIFTWLWQIRSQNLDELWSLRIRQLWQT